MNQEKSKVDECYVFTNGNDVYNELKKVYRTHNQGYFIYGPSGVGKTYFVQNQKVKNWIDGDELWGKANVFPKGDWWNFSGEEIDRVERRADIITEEAKRLGFWIIGASSVNMVPDAIVMPDFETHLKQIKYREEHCYDGGMKSDDLERIKKIEIILQDSIKMVSLFLKVFMKLFLILKIKRIILPIHVSHNFFFTIYKKRNPSTIFYIHPCTFLPV